MGIAQRIAELYAAKMNAVLDRAADPRELADYSYAQLQDLLTEVHRDAAQVAGHGSPRGLRYRSMRWVKLDRMIMHKIAQATIRAFTRQIAAAIEHPAASPESTHAGTLPEPSSWPEIEAQ